MTKKRVREDMKVGNMKNRRLKGIPMVKRGVPQPGITKKEFMNVLTKASQPIPHEPKPDLEKSET
jgi:hypothetical protein